MILLVYIRTLTVASITNGHLCLLRRNQRDPRRTDTTPPREHKGKSTSNISFNLTIVDSGTILEGKATQCMFFILSKRVGGDFKRDLRELFVLVVCRSLVVLRIGERSKREFLVIREF